MTEIPKELFPLIFDSIGDGVFTVDENFQITSFNAAAENITGISRGDAIGQYCHSVFRANICQKRCALRETIKTGKPRQDIQVDILNSDMESVPILVSTAVLKDKDGKMIGGVEIFRDVSDVEYLRSELKQLHHFHDMVGQSNAMREIFSLIPQVAGSDIPVLINGPSGTGKELVAQAIHQLSSAGNKAFVQVNCGALPDTLLESELFGHEKGAFTGAASAKPGRFQQADGGTLFLDEIGDISPAFQVKLLRALEEGEIQPLGGTSTLKVNVRVICATNRNLAKLVEQEKFREDLYYRIRVIEIELPALKDRREDIPLLVNHFIKQISARIDRKPPEINRKAMQLLYDYDYPGNIRELRNIFERAFVLCGDTIEPGCLPPELQSGSTWRDKETEESIQENTAGTENLKGGNFTENCEARKLKALLDENNWNRTATAKKIGVNRTTLWRWMKECGLG